MKTLRSIFRAVVPFLGMVSLSMTAFSSDFSSLVEQEKSDLNKVYKICHTDKELLRKAHISFGANLLETSEDKKCMYMQLNSEELVKLQTFGFTAELAMNWIIQKKEALDKLQQDAALQATAASIPGYSCYETVEETFSVAQGLATDHPTLATWFDIGDSWEKTNGLGGWDLMVLKLTNSAVTGTKPILFINSSLHAREYTTAPLVLNFAKYLVNNHGVDADATWILDYHEVHLFLIANPDGRKKAETGLSWRKNTNRNYCGATSNNRGADLNRNFTFGWNSAGGSSGNPCDATYRGPSPASEPETQAMEAYVRSIYADNRGPNPTDAAPDDTTGIHLDIHSYGELVLWPWGSTSTIAPNGAQMRTLGRKFAYWNGYTPDQGIGLYPTDGTTEGVSYGELGVPSYTFELGTSFFQSCSAYTNTIRPDNMPVLIYAAKAVRAPYLIPSGPNVENVSFSPSTATSGTTVTLTATVSDARFSTKKGTETTQNISEVEYYVTTPPWVSSPTPVANAMSASDGSFNEKTEEVTATIDTTGWANGKYMVFVRGKDTSNAWGAISAGYLTISDEIPPPEYCSSNSTNQNDEWIAQVDIGTLSNSSGASPYTDYTAISVDLQKDSAVSVTLTPGFTGTVYSEYWRVWIDLNADGDFTDAGENVFSGSGQSAISGSFTVPVTAITGSTRMRISMKYNAYADPCGSFTYGEVEDYTVNLVDPVSGPQASFSVSTDQLTATFTDTSTSSGSTIVSRSWNFGDGNTSTAQNPVHTYAAGGTYTVTLTVEDNNTETDSSSQSVTVNEPVISYCASQGNSVRYEWVDRVDVGSFSNSSGAAGYSDFTSQVINVTRGQGYAAAFSPGFASGSYSEYWKVWIDFNQDGDFADSGEEVFSQSGNSDVSGTISIPVSANTGNTRMRVSMRYNANPSSCGSFSYGEVEDYTVNIGN